MFHTNRFETNNYNAFPYEKTVHEHKAPTDESIRLYGELLDKARFSLVKSINIDNGIKAEVNFYKEDGRKTVAYYKLVINEVEICNKVEIYDSVEERMDINALYNLIRERIVEKIAESITTHFMQELSSL